MVNTFYFCPHKVLRGVLGTTGRIIVFVNFHLYSVILYRLKISVFLGGRILQYTEMFISLLKSIHLSVSKLLAISDIRVPF